jgi:hypothetical protein
MISSFGNLDSVAQVLASIMRYQWSHVFLLCFVEICFFSRSQNPPTVRASSFQRYILWPYHSSLVDRRLLSLAAPTLKAFLSALSLQARATTLVRLPTSLCCFQLLTHFWNCHLLILFSDYKVRPGPNEKMRHLQTVFTLAHSDKVSEAPDVLVTFTSQSSQDKYESDPTVQTSMKSSIDSFKVTR